MSDEEVQERTGFSSKADLLAYIFVVCNGDIDLITKKHTVLTWYEAWFMHFEFKWGRTLPRLRDVVREYGPCKRDILRDIKLKYSIKRKARDTWPAYASYKEDMALRNADKWSAKYDGKRPVFWDMTNIPTCAFSDADLNRITYSKYYGMNCLKGGI